MNRKGFFDPTFGGQNEVFNEAVPSRFFPDNFLVPRTMKSFFFFFKISLALIPLLPATGWAQGWKRTFQNLSKPYAIQQTPDGGAVFIATMQDSWTNRDIVLVKTDADGRQQWKKMIGGAGDDEGRSLAMTTDDCIIATGKKSYVTNNGDVYLAKTMLDGNVLWERIFNFGVLDDPKCVRPTPDGGYILALEADNQLRLLKTNAEGLESWSIIYPQTLGQRVNHLEVTPDGGFLVTLLESNLPIVAPIAYVLKTDAAGTFQFEKDYQHLTSYSTTNIAKAKPSGQGQYLLTHRDSVYRLDTAGNLLQSLRITSPYSFYLTDIVPDSDGGFRAYATNYSFTAPPFSRIWLGRYDAGNALIWERNIRAPNYLHSTLAAEQSTDNGFFLTGFFVQNGEYTSYLLRTDSSGQIFTNQITGTVFWDKNQDCMMSPGEPPLPGWVVKIVHPNGETYYASTDSLGHYEAETGQGVHTISVFPPITLWNAACFQDVPVQFDSTFGTANVLFPITNTADCPLLWVDAGVANWIPCTENMLVIHYANQGTAPAPAATVRLTFDTLMTVVGASINYTQTGTHGYLFQLGDLAALENGAFTVQVVPACDGLIFGQTKCVTAEIEPEAPCLSPLDGPFFVASGQCDADSVRFHIQNISAGAPGVLEFIIIEDDIMYAQPDALQLGAGQQITYSFPANGATWRFEALQDSGVPDWAGDAHITAVVEGCTESGAFSTGFVNQFSLFDGGNFAETECREVVAAPGGTAKVAYPSGYETEHFITANTDIEYTLHFQNTTGDTALFVVLRDTIDTAYLEIASILPGPASHPYLMTISNTGVLVFRFDSILMPPGEQGWVKFRIAQRPDLPNGTVIRNGASVGFGFGTPVLTNETFHTVTNPMLSGVNTISAHPEKPPFEIWPVPTLSTAFIEMSQAGNYTASVSDLNGRLLLEKNFSGKRLRIADAELPAGIFIVTIQEGHRLVGATRLVKFQ